MKNAIILQRTSPYPTLCPTHCPYFLTASRGQADIEAAVEVGRHRATDQLLSCEKDLQELAERNAQFKSKNSPATVL